MTAAVGYKTIMKYYGVRPVVIAYMPVPDNPLLMRVTRKSDMSGHDNTMDLAITEAQLVEWLGPAKPYIQNVMPHLSREQREFLISGATPAEWETAFGKED